MGDGQIEIEIESSLPDLSDLDLATLDDIDNPVLARAVERLRTSVDSAGGPLSGFSSST